MTTNGGDVVIKGHTDNDESIFNTNQTITNTGGNISAIKGDGINSLINPTVEINQSFIGDTNLVSVSNTSRIELTN